MKPGQPQADLWILTRGDINEGDIYVPSLHIYPQAQTSKEKLYDKGDATTIDDDLAFVLKVDGDLAADVRLHLPHPPSRLQGMAHEHARLKDRC